MTKNSTNFQLMGIFCVLLTITTNQELIMVMKKTATPIASIYHNKKKERIPASSRELIDSVDGIDIEKYLRRNPNGKIKIPMKYKKAFICIDVEEDHSSTNKNYLKGFMRLHLRGIGIRNVEGGLLQGLTPVAQKKAYQVWYTSNPFLEYL